MSTTSYIYGNLSAGTISATTVSASNLTLNSLGSGTSITTLGLDSSGNIVSGASGGAVSYWTSGSSGSYSVRVLNDSGTDAVGSYSYAEGYNTTSLSIGSHAEGNSTTAFGQASHAQGVVTIANGDYSFAAGSGATASTIYAVAIGNNVIASGSPIDNIISTPINIFSSCTTTLSDPNNSLPAVVFDGDVVQEWFLYLNDFASDFYLYNTGYQIITYNGYVDIYYDSATTYTYYVNTEISATTYTSISGSSFVDINYPFETGACSFGSENSSIGAYAFTEGWKTTSRGIASHAEGYQTTAVHNYSHAEGQLSKAGWRPFGVNSVIEGLISINIDTDITSSFTSGNVILGGDIYSYNSVNYSAGVFTIQLNDVTANFSSYVSDEENLYNENSNLNPSLGRGSHAEGVYTTALLSSHSEGYKTTAYGGFSHSEGYITTAKADYSHAEGYVTAAIGDASHSEGINTTAIGNYSHAGGSSSIASGNTSFVHSLGSIVIGSRSAIIGGQEITGATSDTVYVPDFVIKKVASIPSGSTDSTVGEAGSITWDNTYLYFRTSTQWLRISGLTF